MDDAGNARRWCSGFLALLLALLLVAAPTARALEVHVDGRVKAAEEPGFHILPPHWNSATDDAALGPDTGERWLFLQGIDRPGTLVITVPFATDASSLSAYPLARIRSGEYRATGAYALNTGGHSRFFVEDGPYLLILDWQERERDPAVRLDFFPDADGEGCIHLHPGTAEVSCKESWYAPLYRMKVQPSLHARFMDLQARIGNVGTAKAVADMTHVVTTDTALDVALIATDGKRAAGGVIAKKLGQLLGVGLEGTGDSQLDGFITDQVIQHGLTIANLFVQPHNVATWIGVAQQLGSDLASIRNNIAGIAALDELEERSNEVFLTRLMLETFIEKSFGDWDTLVVNAGYERGSTPGFEALVDGFADRAGLDTGLFGKDDYDWQAVETLFHQEVDEHADWLEVRSTLDNPFGDVDGDGISNTREVKQGTDPNDAESPPQRPADMEEARRQIVALYIAMFGRAPDREGLMYWTEKYASGALADYAAVAEAMYATDAAREQFPRGIGNEELIATFYRNTLGREPDRQGLRYWTDKLERHDSIGRVVSAMIRAVEEYDGTSAAGQRSRDLFRNKLNVSEYYVSVDGTGGDSAYRILEPVTAELDTSDLGRLDDLVQQAQQAVPDDGTDEPGSGTDDGDSGGKDGSAGSGDDADGSETPFRRTAHRYAFDADRSLICANEFGASYDVADWADVVAYFDNGGSLAAFYRDTGLTPEDKSAAVLRNGEQFYSASRAYYISRHDGQLPSHYLSHDNIQSHEIDLGSWGSDRKVLCVSGRAGDETDSNPILVNQFDARADFKTSVGTLHVTGFDSIEAHSRSRTQVREDGFPPLRIRGKGGFFVDEDFGYPKQYVSLSPPNVAAPRNNETTVTFTNDARAVSAFGVYFIDADFPDIGRTRISIYDADDNLLATETVITEDGESQFIGFQTVNEKNERPVRGIAEVYLKTGSGDPTLQRTEGVVMDDMIIPAADH
ncbi:DUF4214 domain-containing protein [Arhodomonas sp. SL1]|uniref:DUF4214 domain-containing protein n=1 Tax=Arhodomonas sp. SL1 TaxID=3425691 RepID=UPI003F883CE2